MIQFVINDTSRFSAPEQAQMAVEAGCRWLELNPAAISNPASVRDQMQQIIDICRESETFLVLADDVDLAEELHVHGVTLSNPDPAFVGAVRERLGAEAIIGIRTNSPDAAARLRGLDIDYLILSLPPAADNVVASFLAVVEPILTSGLQLHLVAEGNFTKEQMRMLLAAGLSGFALTSALLANSDSEAALRMRFTE